MNLVDRTSPLWQGSLSLGLERVEAPLPNEPPSARPDTATVMAGGTVTTDVLVNDADPEGGALTLVEADADQGSVTVDPDGTLTYTAPADFSGPATITYIVADATGNTSHGTLTVEVVLLSVTEGETPGEFVVSSAPGTLTVTVSEPAEYAGEYVLETADLATGAVNLVPPRLSGTPEAGATLVAHPGLWAFDDADAPLDVARTWMRGTTAIEGETGESYVLDTADAGETLRILETARTAAGAREAASAGLEIAAAPEETPWTPARLPGLALWFDASDTATLTLAGSAVTGIADKSGNGRHLAQVTEHPAPTVEAELNGRAALRFPSGGALKSTGARLPGMPGVSVIAVTQAHVSSEFNDCFSVRNDAAAGGAAIFVQTGYSMIWFGNGNRYWTQPASGPVVAVAHYPPNGTHAGTEWWRTGTKLTPTRTAKSSNAISLPADAFFQVGNRNGATSEPAECLLVIGSLSTADRERAEGYLAHKWGLAAGLPDAHPYKAAPPNTMS